MVPATKLISAFFSGSISSPPNTTPPPPYLFLSPMLPLKPPAHPPIPGPYVPTTSLEPVTLGATLQPDIAPILDKLQYNKKLCSDGKGCRYQLSPVPPPVYPLPGVGRTTPLLDSLRACFTLDKRPPCGEIP